MISPTISRVVWFNPGASDKHLVSDQRLAALVTYVHSDRIVNLAVFDANGNNHARISVALMQDDDIGDPDRPFCEWMPFQKGQAAKYDDAKKSEAQMQSNT